MLCFWKMDVEALFAEFEAAKSKRDTKYNSYLLDFDDVGEDTQKLLDAYGRFIEGVRAPMRRPYELGATRSHVCNPTCRRLAFGDFWGCTHNGDLHVCDQAHCDERRQESGEDVCRFTGRHYGKHFDLDLSDRGGTAEQFTTQTPKATKNKMLGPKQKRVKQKVGIKGRKLAPKTQQKLVDPNLLLPDARKQLLKLLEFCEEEVPAGLVDRIGIMCVRLWLRVHELANKVPRALKYNFQYHCVVIAYLMREGYGTADVVLLCEDEFLKNNLPNMKDFSKYGIDTNWHTRIQKQFKYAMTQLKQQEIFTLSAELRKCWT
jgi:hypothetical protein